MDEVEKLIDTIENIRRTFTPESFANQQLARFILRREIEAKIEGYEKAKAFFIINEQNSEAFEIINLNIAELRRELKELEGK